jgi:double-stranded uracil-DNA glycosylase
VPRPRDVVTDRPRILFVGINPGAVSGKVGHHFAGPSNPFWKLLHVAGLTPVELRADEDQRLVEWQYALVNLCARPTKDASELKRKELHAGRKKLVVKVRQMQPAIVALVGITLYPVVFARENRKAPKLDLAPGPGAKPATPLEGAHVFVVPNPSGLNASFPTFDAKLPWFVALRELADQVGAGQPLVSS